MTEKMEELCEQIEWHEDMDKMRSSFEMYILTLI